jgi:hypothetical protein
VRIDRILLIAALMLEMSSSAWAGVTSMKLLAPNVGWATTEDYGKKTLFWTADGGDHWKNITPNPFATFSFWILTEYECCFAAIFHALPRIGMMNCHNTTWP